MSFTDKVVIVTGSSTGIGATIAIKFAEEGAKVVIVGRNQKKVKDVAAKCGKSLALVADITKDQDCKRIIDETIARFGRLDVLVNNAGIYKVEKITSENAMAIFDETIAINLRTPVFLTNLAAKHLIETKGNIVNISSISALRAMSTGAFSYCASKAGLDHFARAVALDLSSSGVRVNTINPGPVRTDIVDDATWTLFEKNTALKRISETSEVANLALYLASDKAVGITGASITVDNGMLLTSSM